MFHLVNLAGPGDVGRATPEDALHRRHRPLSFKHPTRPTLLFVLQNRFPLLPILLYSSDYPKLQITHGLVCPHTSAAQKLANVHSATCTKTTTLLSGTIFKFFSYLKIRLYGAQQAPEAFPLG
jgi:hypothetical protein